MLDHAALARSLSVHPFFSGFDAPVLDALVRAGATRRFERDETIFLKGDAGDALYIVRRGQVRIVTGSEDGRRLTLNILGVSDLFGEIALFDGGARSADAVALERTELFAIGRRDLFAVLQRFPEAAMHLLGLLCERLRWMSDRVEERSLLPLSARLARRLASLSADYGEELLVSQEELARYVGGTRESVNRQLRDWQRQGVVRLGRGRVNVVDGCRLPCDLNAY